MVVAVAGRITMAHQIRVLMAALAVALLEAQVVLATLVVLLRVDKVVQVVLANQTQIMSAAVVVAQGLLVQQGLWILLAMEEMDHPHPLMAQLPMLAVVVEENTAAAALVVTGELVGVAMPVQR
jgi:hypothetical protein